MIHSNTQGLVAGGWMESLATFGIALDSTSYGHFGSLIFQDAFSRQPRRIRGGWESFLPSACPEARMTLIIELFISSSSLAIIPNPQKTSIILEETKWPEWERKGYACGNRIEYILYYHSLWLLLLVSIMGVGMCLSSSSLTGCRAEVVWPAEVGFNFKGVSSKDKEFIFKCGPQVTPKRARLIFTPGFQFVPLSSHQNEFMCSVKGHMEII